jgi:hypothetical protein
MCDLGRGVGERDSPLESGAGLFTTAKLVEQRALHTEEVEIGEKAISSGSIMASAASGPRILATATARLSVTTGDGCKLASMA